MPFSATGKKVTRNGTSRQTCRCVLLDGASDGGGLHRRLVLTKQSRLRGEKLLLIQVQLRSRLLGICLKGGAGCYLAYHELAYFVFSDEDSLFAELRQIFHPNGWLEANGSRAVMNINAQVTYQICSRYCID